MAPRSTAGCYTCKRRKKKCDETKPQCLRCTRSGKVCEGYAPLENPDSRGIMRRGKVAPGPKSSDTPDILEEPSSSNSLDSTNVSDQQGSSDPLTLPLHRGPSYSQWPSTGTSVSFPLPGAIWNHNAVDPMFPLVEGLSTGLPAPPFEYLYPGAESDNILPYPPGTTNYLAHQHFEDVNSSQTLLWPNLPRHRQLVGPGLPYRPVSELKEGGDPEDDPGAKQEMYTVPVPDPNTVDNTLPFILQSYARWINLVVFEPEKGMHPMKAGIVYQFMNSPGERTKIILLANAIGSLGTSIKTGPRVASLISILRTQAYQIIDEFKSTQPASEREVDRQNALKALDLMMEVVLIQRYAYSMLTIVQLMEAASPIFRRACPEPLDQYVNLPGAIMSHAINIRHFATTDVIISITTGRPLMFRYDTTYPPGILELIKGGSGMQWLHGVADQYIVILARINVLFEDFGVTIDPQYVTEIENQIREVDTPNEHEVDPVSTIWKFTVRECWRLTMFIYLYMVLSRTSTDDPRVLKRVKTYTRLMEAVKPGRNPDSFLYIPMIIVGASAYRKRDREVIRRRMLGLQECLNPGSCGDDAMHMLIDLWERTEAENRPAVWDDLRMSAFQVTGI